MNAIEALRLFEEREISAAAESACLIDLLRERIQGYFDSHHYSGYSSGWKLKNLELPGREDKMYTTTVWAIPKGIDEEILKRDELWENGLKEVGEEFGVNIQIPFGCYMK